MSHIFAKDWIDMVFDDKNKDYGAFVLRQQSDKRHMTAIIVGFSFMVLGVTAPTIIKSIIPKKKEVNTEVTTLSDIKLDAPKEQEEIKQIEVPPPPTRSTIAFVAPKATKEEVQEEIKTQEELQDNKADIGTEDIKGDDDLERDLSDLDNDTKAIAAAPDPVFEAVEQMPQFPGGVEKLYEYLGKNIVYPQSSIEMNEKGTVYVQFVVGKNGKIRDVKILRGVSKALDNEAQRVIANMPAWTPARQNGVAVSCKYMVPVKFTLKE